LPTSEPPSVKPSPGSDWSWVLLLLCLTGVTLLLLRDRSDAP
jgi:hypothetical protein